MNKEQRVFTEAQSSSAGGGGALCFPLAASALKKGFACKILVTDQYSDSRDIIIFMLRLCWIECVMRPSGFLVFSLDKSNKVKSKVMTSYS